MDTYHKIQTVFLRDPDTNYKTLLWKCWARPEFEYLAYSNWCFTEKVDGTNIRLIWNEGKFEVKGKTDKAQLPIALQRELDNLVECLTEPVRELFGTNTVTFYGEGYGAGIQKGGGLYAPKPSFVLFDILSSYTAQATHNPLWIERKNVEDIAKKLGIDVVPVVAEGNLFNGIGMVVDGFDSAWGDFIAEGVIARPSIELKNRFGERIITKFKHKDFQNGIGK